MAQKTHGKRSGTAGRPKAVAAPDEDERRPIGSAVLAVSATHAATNGEPAQAAPRKFPKKILFRTLCGLFAAVCIYRIATFAPQPIDSPRTLRHLLYPLLTLFISHYQYTEVLAKDWTNWCLIALILPAALALLNLYSARGVFPLRGRAGRILCSRALFFGSLGVGLLVCRFPVFLGGPANPDESQFLAAAQKLFVDPVFFRSVDCGSTGPGNIYPLMLPAAAGLSPDYASGRVIALLLILCSLYFLYRAFGEFGEEHIARIAIVPAFVFFSVVSHPDFIHYSSEHVSLLLTSLAVFVAARTIRRPERYRGPIAGLGALAAVAFFSKMQAVPIVGAAGLVALARVYCTEKRVRFWRPAVFYLAGLAPLPAANAAVCLAVGGWRTFLMAYIRGNWNYPGAVRNASFLSDISQFTSYLALTREFQFYFLGLLVVLACGVFRALRREPRSEYPLFLELAGLSVALIAGWVYLGSCAPSVFEMAVVLCFLTAPAAVVFLLITGAGGDPEKNWFGVLAGAVTLAATYAVYAPHRMFPHYLLLLAIPLCAVSGWLLLRCYDREEPVLAGFRTIKPRRRLPGLAFALIFLSVPLGAARYQVSFLPYNLFPVPPSTLASEEGALIQKLTLPGASIVVWGWNSRLYVDSGRTAATRDTAGAAFVYGPGNSDPFYRDRFLQDLRRRPADLLVDALATSCCYFNDRNQHGFELDPLIAQYLNSRYVQVAEKNGNRFYLRRDLAKGAGKN